MSDVGHRDGDDLRSILDVLADQEQRLSAKRAAVQTVMDACSAEITRRYRDGEADVASLLAES